MDIKWSDLSFLLLILIISISVYISSIMYNLVIDFDINYFIGLFIILYLLKKFEKYFIKNYLPKRMYDNGIKFLSIAVFGTLLNIILNNNNFLEALYLLSFMLVGLFIIAAVIYEIYYDIKS